MKIDRKNVLEGGVFDNRAQKFEIAVVWIAWGLGSKSSSTVEVKRCIAIHCRETGHRPSKLLASRLFAVQ
jgi:hypothetical protein